MPFSKPLKTYKKLARKRYTARKSRAIRRIMRGQSGVFNYNYRVLYGQVTITNGTTSSINAITFKLDNLVNSAELKALYDEYRINKIIVKFLPRGAPMSEGTISANGQQYLNSYEPFLTAIDYNDSNTVTRNEVFEMGTCRVHKPLTYIRREFVPKIAIQNYVSSLSTGYSSKSGQWIDTVNSDVPHFGFRWSWKQSVSQSLGDQVLYDVVVHYNVSFRNTK